MIRIDWNPIAHVGPIPINWYGLGWVAAFLAGRSLVRCWAPRYGVSLTAVDDLILWSFAGSFIGARLYYVVQNDFQFYITHPWKILATWEGGLAFFGGLAGGILAAYLCARRGALPFPRVADLFAPAVPIAAAIGRIPCGFDGMDYGTPTRLPWAVVYVNPASYAPLDGVARHPGQFYEAAGDVAIAALLLKLRDRLPEGGLFLLYLMLFSVLRFFLFFVRGDVPLVALGLKNAQWAALVILAVSVYLTATRVQWRRRPEQRA